MTSLALGPADIDGRETARWTASFALVLGLHAAAIAGVMAYKTVVSESGEALPAVMIDMAPPPAAPTAAPSDAAPSEAVPEATLPDPVVDAPPDVPEPEIAPLRPAVLAEMPPLEPVPDIPEDPRLQPPPVVQEKAAVALPPPVRQAAPPPPKPVVEKPVRKPPKPVQARRDPERREARRPPSAEAGAQTTASIPSQSSGSSAASKSSWQGAIVAALNRAKRPQAESGLASVRFSVDRGGRILSASLAGSAGSAMLDGEAVGLVRRASIPAAPGDVPGSTFTFTVPIRFTSR